MTASDDGKYSRKHPPGTLPDPDVAAALAEVAADGRVSCAVAHDLAAELEVAPAEVGKTMDLLEYRISMCQMGLFGFEPISKIVKPAEVVDDELAARLRSAAPENRISCASCWQIAQDEGLRKMQVAAACEALGLKITPCQLGAF